MLDISLWDGNRVSTLRHFLCHLTERMTQRREKLLAWGSPTFVALGDWDGAIPMLELS